MPTTKTSLVDITHSLEAVYGGAAGRAIANVARTAWNAAKPWLGRADTAVETFGKYAGGALAAKEGYDLVRGNGTGTGGTPATPATPMTPSAVTPPSGD
jgi:hypothetical protein